MLGLEHTACLEFLLSSKLIDESQADELLKVKSLNGKSVHLVALEKGYVSRSNYYSQLIAAGHKTYKTPSLESLKELSWVASNFQFYIDQGFLPITDQGGVIEILSGNPFIHDLGDFISFKKAKGWRINIRLVNDISLQLLSHNLYAFNKNIKLVTGPVEEKGAPSKKRLPLIFLGAILLLLLSFNLWPVQAFSSVSVLISLSFICLTIVLYMPAMRFAEVPRLPDPVKGSLSETARFGVYIHLKSGSRAVNRLIKSLENIEYPREKLEVIFLIEEADKHLIELFAEHGSKIRAEILVVPSHIGSNKAAIYNHALSFSKAKFCCFSTENQAFVQDAFLQAESELKRSKKSLAGLRGTVVWYGLAKGWLNKMLELRESYLIGQAIPFYTSNFKCVPNTLTGLFFKKEMLVKLGGFNPKSMQPEASLLLKFSRSGLSIGSIPVKIYMLGSQNFKVFIKANKRRYFEAVQLFKEFGKKDRGANLVSSFKMRLPLLMHLFLPLVFQLLLPAVFAQFLLLVLIDQSIALSWPGFLALIAWTLPLGLMLYAFFMTAVQSKTKGLVSYALLLPIAFVAESTYLVYSIISSVFIKRRAT